MSRFYTLDAANALVPDLAVVTGRLREQRDELVGVRDAYREREGVILGDVIDELPEGSAAALLLLEHRWAIPVRDAIHRAGGFHVTDGWIHPLDLVEIGLLAADESQAMTPGAPA